MEIITLVLFLQYGYLVLRTLKFPLFFDNEDQLTKSEVKRYFIPLIGIFFMFKNWYDNLPEY